MNSMDRRGFLKSAAAGVGTVLAFSEAASSAPSTPASKGKCVAGLKSEPIETVRIGMIDTTRRNQVSQLVFWFRWMSDGD